MKRLQFLKNLPAVQTGSLKRILTVQATNNNNVTEANFSNSNNNNNNTNPNEKSYARPITATHLGEDSGNSNGMRKSNSLAHASKLARHQSTSVLFSKKNEEMKNKLNELDQEIQDVERQIAECRKDIANKKRTKTYIPRDSSSSSRNVTSNNFFLTSGTGAANPNQTTRSNYRKNININSPQELRAQILIAEKRINTLKTKMNTSNDQHKGIMAEIDALRKEITMYSKLNAQVSHDLESTNYQYDRITTESKMVSNDVATKYQELYKAKIANSHGELKIIKCYDQILRTLTKELQTDRLKELHEKHNFMLTEAATNQHFNSVHSAANLNDPSKPMTSVPALKLSSSNSMLSPSSPNKRRRMQQGQPLTLNQLRLLLANYDQQFNKLKLETGTEDVDEIMKKYMEEYESNYGTYKYINNLADQVTAENEETEHLQQRIREVREQNMNNVRGEEIDSIKSEIAEASAKVDALKEDKLDSEKVIKQLKVCLPVVLERLGITPMHPALSGVDIRSIQDYQLIPLLLLIQQRKKELVPSQATNSIQLGGMGRLQNKSIVYDVDEQIEAAKREYEQFTKTDYEKKHTSSKDDGVTKYENFLKKEDLIKTIELDKKIRKPRKKV